MVLLVLPPADHLWIGSNRGQFVPSRRRRTRANVRAERSLKIPAEPAPSCVSPGTAAQTRIVSVARIRLDSRKSVRPFKEIICGDISEFESSLSGRVGVKHFQTARSILVFDATRRVLASLRDRHFGPPMMGLGGCGGPISRYVLAVRATAGIRLETDSPHPSSLRGHRSTDRRNSGFLLVFYCAHLAMRRRHDECHKCASMDGRSCLLGRAERSSPKAAQRRAAGAGLDGERAHRAIIRAVAMHIII
jgi:hypothetical protein